LPAPGRTGERGKVKIDIGDSEFVVLCAHRARAGRPCSACLPASNITAGEVAFGTRRRRCWWRSRPNSFAVTFISG